MSLYTSLLDYALYCPDSRLQDSWPTPFTTTPEQYLMLCGDPGPIWTHANFMTDPLELRMLALFIHYSTTDRQP